MVKIKVVFYETHCECPKFLKESIQHCNSECYECSYFVTHKHIIAGEYKRIEYDETSGTFAYGYKKVDIFDPDYLNYIEYLEIDGDVIINLKEEEGAE